MVNQVHTHNPTSGGAIHGCQCNAPLAPEPVYGAVSKPHTHVTPTGVVVECYHDCKKQLSKTSFWVLTTLIFPIEHAIWTMTPLKHLAQWAGL